MSAAGRGLGWILPVLILVVAACGSNDRFDLRTPRAKATPTVRPSGDIAAPGKSLDEIEPVTRGEERVIRGWAASLRHGHVGRAARYFRLPALVSNGTSPLPITTRAQARQFNRALPCGAIVVRLERSVHHFVATTFRLVERPGPGSCGDGVGRLARTAFLIKHGLIAQWFRLPDPPQQTG